MGAITPPRLAWASLAILVAAVVWVQLTPPAWKGVVRPLPVPAERPVLEVGTASWYGPGFHGRLTASGEVFDENALTAAHPSLPLGTTVQVTNLENGKRVTLVINDRGPFVAGRVIDLSRAAAERLGFLEDGLARVGIEIISGPRLAARGD